MKRALPLLFVFLLSMYSGSAYSQINLNIKINQVVGSKTVEIVKTITGNYNQDIVIASEGLKNRIVFSLRKFKNILVNGNKINPVQIDMKMVDEAKKVIGKPQTITSFYNKSAEFNASDLNVKVNFEEI
ncbi:hypothetical protein C8D79_3545 [Bacteriovorax stolpii]|nr:hypothetical protein [Bacteriovorax stolpii]TDP51370.1 hypothetical protein C8D79_3545 [Bacteriovorax stolpii]